MSDGMSDAAQDEEPIRYRIRLQEFAQRAIDAEADRLAPIIGDDLTLEWLRALRAAIATLSDMPYRNALAPESRKLSGVWRQSRQLLFRRTDDGPAWRVLFVVETPEDDAPTVRVLIVRHAARGPMTRAEARQALQDT